MKLTVKTGLRRMEELATTLRTSETVKLDYQSALKVFASKSLPLQDYGSSNESVKLAIEEWKQALRNNDFSNIGRRTLRLLCNVSDIAHTKLFITVLSEKLSRASLRIMGSLLRVYFTQWHRRNELQHLEEYLSHQIMQQSAKNSHFSRLAQNLDLLIGLQAPANVAAWTLSEELAPVDGFFRDSRIRGLHTPFGSAVVREISDLLLWGGQSISFDVLAEETWDYFEKEVLLFPSLEKDDRDEIISDTILFVDGERSHENFEKVREKIKSFILNHKNYGDPRINEHKFSEINEQAVKTLVSWLSEEDIALFFDLIIDVDPHRRRPFWLRYVGSVRDSLVVVGEQDYSKQQDRLNKLRQSGRRFSRGYGINTSAFILDFGKYKVVEFSESGNACYIYTAGNFKKLITAASASWIDLQDLKDKDLAARVQSHYSTWQEKLGDYLSSKGIEEDQ